MSGTSLHTAYHDGAASNLQSYLFWLILNPKKIPIHNSETTYVTQPRTEKTYWCKSAIDHITQYAATYLPPPRVTQRLDSHKSMSAPPVKRSVRFSVAKRDDSGRRNKSTIRLSPAHEMCTNNSPIYHILVYMRIPCDNKTHVRRCRRMQRRCGRPTLRLWSIIMKMQIE